MSESPPFTISSRRHSYKDLELVYREHARSLQLSVEMSGVPEYDFVGVDTAFARWTEPQGVALSAEEQSVVRSRIEQWLASEGMRVAFGPPADFEAYFARRQAEGWTIIRGRDAAGLATVTLAPPLKIRLRAWFTRLRDSMRR